MLWFLQSTYPTLNILFPYFDSQGLSDGEHNSEGCGSERIVQKAFVRPLVGRREGRENQGTPYHPSVGPAVGQFQCRRVFVPAANEKQIK